MENNQIQFEDFSPEEQKAIEHLSKCLLGPMKDNHVVSGYREGVRKYPQLRSHMIAYSSTLSNMCYGIFVSQGLTDQSIYKIYDFVEFKKFWQV